MNDDERRMLRYMWEDGEPTAKIAAALNYTPMTIRRVAKEMGLTKRPHGGSHGRIVTDKQIDDIRKMREMRASGATYADIGKAFGINNGLAWHYVNKFELDEEQRDDGQGFL